MNIVGTAPTLNTGDPMNADAHISALQQRHAALQRAIDEESNRPHPDPIVLQELKRRKLQLKDRITQNSVG